MEKLIIPRLYCPFESKLHPLAEELKKHTDEWVIQFNLYQNKEDLERYYNENYSSFTARMYPDADFFQLCIVNDFITLLFVVDDQLDSPNAKNKIEKEENVKKFIKKFMMIVRQEIDLHEEEKNHVFRALKDIWKRLVVNNPAWLPSFVEEIGYVFAAAIWEYENFSHQQIPTMEEYLEKRRFTGAANIATSLIEPLGNFFLTKALKENPIVKELEVLACNIICISNDLFSLSKEQMLGDKHNLLSILQNNNNISLEESISLTAKIHDDLVNKFIDRSKSLSSFNSQENLQLQKYIDSLEIQMAGNVVWSEFETQRYQFRYAEDQVMENKDLS